MHVCTSGSELQACYILHKCYGNDHSLMQSKAQLGDHENVIPEVVGVIFPWKLLTASL